MIINKIELGQGKASSSNHTCICMSHTEVTQSALWQVYKSVFSEAVEEKLIWLI